MSERSTLRAVPELVWVGVVLGLCVGVLVGVPFGAFVARLP